MYFTFMHKSQKSFARLLYCLKKWNTFTIPITPNPQPPSSPTTTGGAFPRSQGFWQNIAYKEYSSYPHLKKILPNLFEKPLVHSTQVIRKWGFQLSLIDHFQPQIYIKLSQLLWWKAIHNPHSASISKSKMI